MAGGPRLAPALRWGRLSPTEGARLFEGARPLRRNRGWNSSSDEDDDSEEEASDSHEHTVTGIPLLRSCKVAGETLVTAGGSQLSPRTKSETALVISESSISTYRLYADDAQIPRSWVVASGWPDLTEWVASPARHILEPALPTLGMPARVRASLELSIMNFRRSGFPFTTKMGSSGPVW